MLIKLFKIFEEGLKGEPYILKQLLLAELSVLGVLNALLNIQLMVDHVHLLFFTDLFELIVKALIAFGETLWISWVLIKANSHLLLLNVLQPWLLGFQEALDFLFEAFAHYKCYQSYNFNLFYNIVFEWIAKITISWLIPSVLVHLLGRELDINFTLSLERSRLASLVIILLLSR